MATHTLIIRRELSVNLPETVDEWQLYDLPGACVAARALTAALKKALQTKDGDAGDRYNRIVYPVALRFAKFGALDTEPRDTAMNILWNTMRTVGVSRYGA